MRTYKWNRIENKGNFSHPLVGRRVLNRHRQSCDYSEEFRLAHHGVITSVLEGCNPSVYVKFDRRDESVAMVAKDLAFVELWPGEGSVVVVNESQ